MLKVKKNIKEVAGKIEEDKKKFNDTLGTSGIEFRINFFEEGGWAKTITDTSLKALIGTYVARMTGYMANVAKEIAKNDFYKEFFLEHVKAVSFEPGPESLDKKYKFTLQETTLVLTWKCSMIAYSADNIFQQIADAMNEAAGYHMKASLKHHVAVYDTAKEIIKGACGAELEIDLDTFFNADPKLLKNDIKDGLGIYIYKRYCPVIANDIVKMCEDEDSKEALEESIKKIIVKCDAANERKYEYEMSDECVYVKCKPDMLAFSMDRGQLSKFLENEL